MSTYPLLLLSRTCVLLRVPPGDHVRHRMEMEVRRMGFDTQNAWRVSDINSNYKYAKESRPVMSVSEG